MSNHAGDNVLEFEVVVNIHASEDMQRTLKQLENAKQVTQSQAKTSSKNSKKVIASGTLQDFEKDKFFQDEEAAAAQKEQQAIKKETLDFLHKLDSQGLQTLSSFATNPTGATLNALTKVLTLAGADAAMFLSVIGIAVATPIVIEQLIKALSVKGGPLNRDWKRYLDKEVDAGLSRQEVRQREQGVDVVILAERTGFLPNNQNWTYNSLFAIDAKRIARIGLSDAAAGVYTS